MPCPPDPIEIEANNESYYYAAVLRLQDELAELARLAERWLGSLPTGNRDAPETQEWWETIRQELKAEREIAITPITLEDFGKPEALQRVFANKEKLREMAKALEISLCAARTFMAARQGWGVPEELGVEWSRQMDLHKKHREEDRVHYINGVKARIHQLQQVAKTANAESAEVIGKEIEQHEAKIREVQALEILPLMVDRSLF